MKEFFQRLASRPLMATELLLASLFANFLALASPLFVVQVLNRYVAYGVDATLATLTVGVLAAILLEMGFRQARLLLASSMLEPRDEDRAIGAYGIMVSAKTQALERIPPGLRRETVSGLTTIETTYNAPNIVAIMDLPFALIFVLALFLLHPALGAIALTFISLTCLYSILNQRLLAPVTQALSQVTGYGNSLITTSARAADTIRAFGGQSHVMANWRTYVNQAQHFRSHVTRRQGMAQTLTQSLQAIMGVAIIGIGAVLVVGGSLDVGTMIGANILAARGLGPAIKWAQMSEAMAKAQDAMAKIRGLAHLPVEEDNGSALESYQGAIEFRDVAFAHGEEQTPLFEQLNLVLPAGSVLLVNGRNGTGKTTLARMLVGLLEPTRGQILVDGVDMRQFSAGWWRRQIMYMPQEPVFLPGTIRENLLAVNENLDDEQINRFLRRAELGGFIDESQKGLDTELIDNGLTLAVGIRRRLALARAVASDGRLVVFDEPTEGLDREGCAGVYQIMKDLAQQGRTIIVITNDPVIQRGARLILDLNSKPVPTITRESKQPALAETGQPGASPPRSRPRK
ncbi:MAG: ATP-binding cassette domain-containing protein [Rhodospirillales bacterium]|nr:ATP-binding cassette domain-containing protein [Rhodospirillales bacterium]